MKCHSNQPKWVNSDFLSRIDEKNHYCNVYRCRPNQFNEARKRDAMKRVKQMNLYLKRTHIKESVKNANGNPKKLWRMIKSIWPDKNKTSAIDNILGSKDKFEMANHLNKHFTNAGAKIGATIEPVEMAQLAAEPNQTLPEMTEISISEVWTLLKNLSPAKAIGLDGISACLLKVCTDLVLEPLYYALSPSLKSKRFPNSRCTLQWISQQP